MYDLIDTIPDTISDRMLVTEAEKSAGKGARGELDAGSVSFALVHASDTEIARNNRLHTLMQVHGRWAAKQQQKNEVEQMKRQNKCEGCGKEKALSMCSGELLCSSCAALAGAVSNRPDLVARMIVRREKTAAIMAAIGVGDAAVAVVESDILEKVADLLGYQPNQEAIDGDDLLGKIEALASDVGQLRAVNNEHIHFLTQLREVLGQPTAPLHDLLATVRRLETDQNQDTKDELVAAQTALDAICRAVGLTDHGELQYKHIVGAVAQQAALLEDSERCPRVEPESLGPVCKALDLEEDATAQDIAAAIDGMRDAYSLLAGDHVLFRRDLADALDIDRDTLDSQIIEAVRALAKDFLFMRAKAAAGGEKKPSLDLLRAISWPDGKVPSWAEVELAVMQIAARFEDARGEHFEFLLKLRRALGQHGAYAYEQEIERSVAHLAAIIDQLMEYAGEYAACPADLLFLVKKQGDELYNMHVNLQAKQDHINLLADQVSEAEQRLLADEQVFSRIREVIGADNAANGDLPTAISALLYGGYAITTKREANHALGSRLLDLLLDFPEIGVERIAEIKEAA